LVVIAGAFTAGTFIESPWGEAVANSQRTPVVTAPVEHRTLHAEDEAVQGKYSAGAEVEVVVPGESGSGVVTAQLKRNGDPVHSGDALVEVSGRPVIGLALPFRMYRDIKPGDEGPDVREVQSALRGIGLYTGGVDGVYGAGTAAAVDALYESSGYLPPEPSPEAVAALEQAEDQAEEAVDAEEAESSTDDAGASVTEGAGGSSTESGQTDDSRAERLAEARFAALTPVLQSEVVQLPQDVATVSKSSKVGAEMAPGTPLLGLRAGRPHLTVRVGVALAPAYAKGAAASVYVITDAAARVPAKVSSVSAFREPDGVNTTIPGYDVTLIFPDKPLKAADGETLVAEPAGAAATVAEGLAVPVVALRDDPDGTYVTVEGAGRVAVEVVRTGDGYAIVETDDLAEGDRVVVSGE
jgi:hypothetical protein